MKRVLITGLNSYVGTEFKKYIDDLYSDEISVSFVNVRNSKWTEKDFQNYDVLFHVAGIVHNKNKKDNKKIFYEINRDLTEKIAKKSKENGVKHFIFMSTFSVYGMNSGLINESTVCHPKNDYGKSKYEAEKKIKEIQDENFKVSIIRSPMIYGPNSPGNYSRLRNIAINSPIFINSNNERSMVFINVLSDFIAQIIINEKSGTFIPQNIEFIKVKEMIKEISEFHNKKIYFIDIPNFFWGIMMKFSLFKKVFGELKYTSKSSELLYIQPIKLKETIEITEKQL